MILAAWHTKMIFPVIKLFLSLSLSPRRERNWIILLCRYVHINGYSHAAVPETSRRQDMSPLYVAFQFVEVANNLLRSINIFVPTSTTSIPFVVMSLPDPPWVQMCPRGLRAQDRWAENCDMAWHNMTINLTSLWSSCQGSWLQNGDVLCFLWGTNWIYICRRK
jgi:hypothetical protein